MTIPLPKQWPQPDGTPVSAPAKLRMLAESHAELARTMQDVFDDAVLLGVDEAAMQGIINDMTRALASPRRGRLSK